MFNNQQKLVKTGNMFLNLDQNNWLKHFLCPLLIVFYLNYPRNREYHFYLAQNSYNSSMFKTHVIKILEVLNTIFYIVYTPQIL